MENIVNIWGRGSFGSKILHNNVTVILITPLEISDVSGILRHYCKKFKNKKL